MKAGIYEICSNIDHRKYIGSSVNLYKRKNQHYSDLRLKKHPNSYLQNFYNKYGEESLSFNIITFCNKTQLEYLEQYYVEKYDFKNLFNIRPIVNSNIGIVRSSETRLNMSKAAKLRPTSFGNGQKITEVGKVKMLENLKLIQRNKRKEILQYDSQLNLLNSWESITRAAYETKISRTAINNCLKNLSKTAGSYIWKYNKNKIYNNMENKYLPVQNTIEVIILGFTLQKDIAAALDGDNKITWTDVFKFTNLLKVGPAAINDIANIKAEIAIEENRKLVIEYFENEFDIPNDELEARIEETLNWLETTYELVKKWFPNI